MSTQAQKMPARPNCSLLGSPSWYPCRVPTSAYLEIIGRGGMQGLPPHPPPPPPQFWPGHISGPSIRNPKFPSSPVSLSRLAIWSQSKNFDETASFLRNFDFFLHFWGFGGFSTCIFSGTPECVKFTGFSILPDPGCPGDPW